MATFSGPTRTVRGTPTADSLWFPKQARGITVYKDQAGVWHETEYASDDFLAAQARVYRGGYTYTVDATEVSELTAAGYGAYVSG